MKRIISDDEYTLIRKKLSADSPKVIKMGIQDMLALLEKGRRFPGIARMEKQDFQAFIMNILENSDVDVRKWLYHLLCVYHDPYVNEILLHHCIKNVSVEIQEASQDGIENISWIVAVGATHSTTQSEFITFLKNGKFYEYLTDSQIMLAGAAFRDAPFHSIDRQVYQAVIQPNDPISSIWVTKIYANHFLSILKSGHYSERHGNITTDMLSELLNHPNEIVRKYAMWAFAQEEGIGFESILPYVRLENAFSMESGKLKWYFVKMFQDLNFLNRDLLQEVGGRLRKLPVNVREGILIGCDKADYSFDLADFLLDWETSGWEENENVLLRLYEYFVKNLDKNQDFYEVIKSAVKNIDKLPSKQIRQFIRKFLSTENGRCFMDSTGINISGNVQINYGNYNRQVNQEADKNRNRQILEKLETLQKLFEQEKDDFDEKFNQQMSHIEYECGQLLQKAGMSQYQDIVEKLDELKCAKPKERGKHIAGFLSTLSNLITITSVTPVYPEFQAFVENMLIYVDTLLKSCI